MIVTINNATGKYHVHTEQVWNVIKGVKHKGTPLHTQITDPAVIAQVVALNEKGNTQPQIHPPSVKVIEFAPDAGPVVTPVFTTQPTETETETSPEPKRRGRKPKTETPQQ